MYIFRYIIAAVVVLFALLFWFAALTVPAISATPYLILALVLTVVAYFVSPFRFRKAQT